MHLLEVVTSACKSSLCRSQHLPLLRVLICDLLVMSGSTDISSCSIAPACFPATISPYKHSHLHLLLLFSNKRGSGVPAGHCCLGPKSMLSADETGHLPAMSASLRSLSMTRKSNMAQFPLSHSAFSNVILVKQSTC